MNQTLLKKYLVTIMVILLSIPVFSQEKNITGSVKNEAGEALAGATIRVKGTSLAVTTDNLGAFNLAVPNSATALEVSFVGYQSKEVAIAGEHIDIQLQSSSDQRLDEVVVIGYGTARKKDLTDSLVTIQAKIFNKGLMTATDQLIQGKTPGVMVINNTGQPGGSATVRIRGNSSIRASNNPLFVLDG